VRTMFKKLIIAALAAGLFFGPLPAGAVRILDSVPRLPSTELPLPNSGQVGTSRSEFSIFVQVEETDQGLEVASLDKEKPSKEEKPQKEEKESKSKKKYDNFKDKNKNGIDDRFEKPTRPGKESPKKGKKDEPGEVNF